ncbi:hypothetical protein IJ670_02010 [bacterium]|nr:hypothetical protein [bacterium]
MISLLNVLHKQNLISQKNHLYSEMLSNSQAQRNMLNNSFFGGVNTTNPALLDTQNTYALENINNMAQLMAINAELQALDSHKVNYLA